jgi:hypothetical protein
MFGIKSLFKRNNKVRNIYHPDVKSKVEYSHTISGVKYYSFKEDHTILAGRYFHAARFFRELGMGITSELLVEYLKLILKDLDSGKASKAAIKIGEIIRRTELAVEPETLYRLASAVYFDDSESVDDYDRKYNEQKIAAWKKEGQLDFFYSQPMSRYIGLQNFSPSDLKTSFEEVEDFNKRVHQLMYEL